MLDTAFVAAILGIEGTLAELLERVEDRDLSEPLEALQDRTAAVRHSFEEMGAINRNGYVGDTSSDQDADKRGDRHRPPAELVSVSFGNIHDAPDSRE